MPMTNTESELLVQNIVEFYNTLSDVRRKDLQDILDQLMERSNAWPVAFDLIKESRPINVQFYGANLLYHNLNRYFDQLAENSDHIGLLKNFYIKVLTDRAISIPHSVLNKLSSGFAVLILKSVPDIWQNPFQDLILLWTNQLELLLRVFAEIAAEFHRLTVPLNHRNSIKTELNNIESNVVQLSQHVLEDSDSSGSLRNAAIECLELWLKLPNAKLDAFMGVFSAIFINLGNDFPAIARILSTIKSNEEFSKRPRLIWQITQYIAYNICPRIQSELDFSASQHVEQLLDAMEELIPLLSVLVDFSQDFVQQIVKQVCSNISDPNETGTYFALCQFFFHISNLPGTYPVDECISDLPEPWWRVLREELLQPDEGSALSMAKQQLGNESCKWYLNMLDMAIAKLSRFPDRISRLDKIALERFIAYRCERSDVSVNAIQVLPEDTIKLLAERLNGALDSFELDRAEATIFLLKECADFISESHLTILLPALLKCGPFDHWLPHISPVSRVELFAYSLLELFVCIEHLLTNYSAPCQTLSSTELLSQIVQTILSCLQLAGGVDEKALNTLAVMLKHRDTPLKNQTHVLDAIISKCFEHFRNKNHNERCRLAAMRCVGIGLSFKDLEFVLKSLDEILAPRLVELNQIAGAAISEQQEANALFELAILAQLMDTLEPSQQNQLNPDTRSPVLLIIDQTLPLFNKLLTVDTPSPKLIAKLCDVLKASVQSLYVRSAPLLETLLDFIDMIIYAYPGPACDLAKTLFLTFHKERGERIAPLVTHLSNWYANQLPRFEQSVLEPNGIDKGEFAEHFLGLAYHLLRKFWDGMLCAATRVDSSEKLNRFINNLCLIISLILQHSRNVSLVQDALRSLNRLLNQCSTCTDNNSCVSVLTLSDTVAERVVSTLFGSISSELTTGNINTIADTLHKLMWKYPTLTRTTITTMLGADSSLVGSIFSSPTSRNVRLRCAQIHQKALLQKVPQK